MTATEQRATNLPELAYYIRERGIDPKDVLDIYGLGVRRGADWADAAWHRLHADEALETANDKDSVRVAQRAACSPGCHCGNVAARVDREWHAGPHCGICMESDGYPRIRAVEKREAWQDGEEEWVCEWHSEYLDRLAEQKAEREANERPATKRPEWLDLDLFRA